VCWIVLLTNRKTSRWIASVLSGFSRTRVLQVPTHSLVFKSVIEERTIIGISRYSGVLEAFGWIQIHPYRAYWDLWLWDRTFLRAFVLTPQLVCRSDYPEPFIFNDAATNFSPSLNHQQPKTTCPYFYFLFYIQSSWKTYQFKCIEILCSISDEPMKR